MEITRAVMPGGGTVAIVTELEGEALGATVATGYRVYLQGAGPDARLEQVAQLYRSVPPEVSWMGKDRLLLRVSCGEVQSFTNFATVAYGSHDGVLEQVMVKLDNDGLCA